MSHVEIEPPAIQQKAAVARRFLVVAVMQIDRARLGLAKEIVFDLGRPKLGIGARLFLAQKAAVFGFNSNDPIHRSN